MKALGNIGRTAPAVTPEEREQTRRRAQLALLSIALLALTTLPSAISLLQEGRASGLGQSTGSVVMSPLGATVQTFLPWVVLLIAGVIVLRSLQTSHPSGRVLFVQLLGIAAVAGATVWHARSLSGQMTLLIIAAIAIAVWSVKPTLDDLVVFGRIGVGIAIVSLGMAATTSLAWMPADEESKSLFGDRVLAGFFPQMNVLGMSLAATLPFVGLFASRATKVLGALAILVALVLSASRTSLIAVGAGLIGVLVLVVVSRRARPLVSGLAICVIAAAGVIIPLVAHNDLIFTGRGRVWRVSTSLLADRPLVGQGLAIYAPEGAVAKLAYGSVYWHAHNTFMTFALILGIVGLGGLILIFAPALRSAVQRSSTDLVPIAAMLTILSLGIAEAPLRPNEFDGPAWVTWMVLFAVGLIPHPASQPSSLPSPAPNGPVQITRDQR